MTNEHSDRTEATESVNANVDDTVNSFRNENLLNVVLESHDSDTGMDDVDEEAQSSHRRKKLFIDDSHSIFGADRSESSSQNHVVSAKVAAGTILDLIETDNPDLIGESQNRTYDGSKLDEDTLVVNADILCLNCSTSVLNSSSSNIFHPASRNIDDSNGGTLMIVDDRADTFQQENKSPAHIDILDSPQHEIGTLVNSNSSDFTESSGSSTVVGSRETSKTTSHDEEDEEHLEQILVDYASKVSGGQILEKSPSLKGSSNLLTEDTDRYAIAPCEDKKYVVIGLSEDILVKIIKLSNYERYSSHVKDFQILANQEYPASSESWSDLGVYSALSKSGEQIFELEQPSWARYLKFKFLSHYGREHYCTLSQIKVHGSTMLQGFHEQWIESEKIDSDTVELENRQDGGTAPEDDELADDDISREDETNEIKRNNTKESDTVSHHNESIDELVVAASPGSLNETELVLVNGLPEITARSETVVNTSNGTSRVLDSSDEEDSSTSIVRFNASLNDKVINSQISDFQKDGAEIKYSTISGSINESTTDVEIDVVADHSSDAPPDNEIATNSTIRHTDALSKIQHNEATSSTGVTNSMSGSMEDSVTLNESSSSIHIVTNAIKAVATDATDVIKIMKDAVQMADAVTEIKKLIRTTISGSDQDNEITNDSTGDANFTIEKGETTLIADKSIIDLKTTKLVGEEPVAVLSDGLSEIVSSTEASTSVIIAAANSTDSLTVVETEDILDESPIHPDMVQTYSSAFGDEGKTAFTYKHDVTILAPSSEDFIRKLLARYPSISCMKGLDFEAFKNRPHAAGTVHSSSVSGAKMEPIFAKLTSEIKLVQTTQHQYENYVSAIKTCYEKVLTEIVGDLDSMQISFDARMSKIEMMLEKNNSTKSSSPFDLRPILSWVFSMNDINTTIIPFLRMNSSQGLNFCIGVIMFCLLLFFRITRKHNSQIPNVLAMAEIPKNSLSGETSKAGRKVLMDGSISPLSLIDAGVGSNSNPPSEAVSYEGSVYAVPAISNYDVTGSTGQKSSQTKWHRDSHRKRFRVRRRIDCDDN